MSKIKICQIISMLCVGGAEKFVTELSKGFDKEKCDVYVIVLFSSIDSILERELIKNDINLIFLDKKRGVDFSIIGKLRKILKKIKPDVINTHLNSLIYAYISTIGLQKRLKIFHTIHSVPHKEASGIKRIIHKFLFKYCNVFPIGISSIISKEAIEQYGLKSIITIYNGIEYLKYYNNKPYLDREIDFIHVGRMCEVKNHIVIIEAMKLVVKKYPNSKMVLIGNGPLEKKLKEEVKKFDLDKNIVFVGITDNVEEYLSNSKIFVFPSLWEGNPLSLLEAISAGCLVLTTQVGGIPDVIKDRENGFFVDCDKESFALAMMHFLKNIINYEKFREDCSIAAQKYDMRIVCDNYYKAYKNVGD